MGKLSKIKFFLFVLHSASQILQPKFLKKMLTLETKICDKNIRAAYCITAGPSSQQQSISSKKFPCRTLFYRKRNQTVEFTAVLIKETAKSHSELDIFSFSSWKNGCFSKQIFSFSPFFDLWRFGGTLVA